MNATDRPVVSPTATASDSDGYENNPASSGGIGVVVVSYQSVATIDECLTRLRAAHGVDAIRVIDNDSGDGTLELVQRHASADPRVRFIANPDNPGFAVACNQGAADLEATDWQGAPRVAWLAFVNPDCLVEIDTLSRMRLLAEPGGDAVLGADIVDEAGVRDAAARRRDPEFATMLPSLLPGARRQASADTATTSLAIAVDDNVALQPVEAISGALMLVNRGLFDRLDGFDPGYRLHVEDLDFCRRARMAGAVIAVANAVRVVHLRGVSSRSRPLFVEWHKHRGLWRYFCKFEAPRRALPTRFAVGLAIALRMPLAALRALARRLGDG